MLTVRPISGRSASRDPEIESHLIGQPESAVVQRIIQVRAGINAGCRAIGRVRVGNGVVKKAIGRHGGVIRVAKARREPFRKVVGPEKLDFVPVIVCQRSVEERILGGIGTVVVLISVEHRSVESRQGIRSVHRQRPAHRRQGDRRPEILTPRLLRRTKIKIVSACPLRYPTTAVPDAFQIRLVSKSSNWLVNSR